jgi:hypothetical protein
MSVRARAREIYGEMAGEAGASSGLAENSASEGNSPREGAAAPNPGPPSQSSGAADLTSRIREMYETSAVPVREVARMAGVTERTLYKYVQKHGWKRRYRCLARDEAVAAANRGRRWEGSPARAGDPAADVTPAKGACGRFIRREDIGKPFASGLKALDPAGRDRALETCGEAERLSRAAQAKASAEERFEARLRAIDTTHRALAAYNDFRRDFAVRGSSGPRPRPPNPNEWPRKESAREKQDKKKQRKKAILPASLFASLERAHVGAIESALQGWLAA